MAETANEDLTEEQFITRFVAHCMKQCGFTHFDDGTAVEDYAIDTAKSYWEDPIYRSDGPEACADGDMDYWGEE